MKKVTRFEIINHTGEEIKLHVLPTGVKNIINFDNSKVKVEYDIQDNDQTLKVFISKK